MTRRYRVFLWWLGLSADEKAQRALEVVAGIALAAAALVYLLGGP